MFNLILDFYISCWWVSGIKQSSALVKGLLVSSKSFLALLCDMSRLTTLFLRHCQTAVWLVHIDFSVCVFSLYYLMRAPGIRSY